MIVVIEMGDGKKQVILLTRIALLFSALLVLTGCQNTGLGGITGNVVQEPNAQYPTPNAQLPTTDLVVGCTDSDGGDEPSVAGTITVVKEGSIVVSNDACTGDADLREQYCLGKQEKVRGYACKYGCREGRCLTSSESGRPGLVPPSRIRTLPSRELETSDRQAIQEEVIAVLEEKDTAHQEEADEAEGQFYNCFNGFKDSFETDVDCGGPCQNKCRYGKMCTDSADCAAGLKCNLRMRKCMERAY